MLLPWLISISAISSAVAGDSGQIPVIDNIIGGVPANVSSSVKGETLHALATTPGALRIVENSGVCETTPGVYQASGYGDIAADKSIFFWYFASRFNPAKAPLALWFNGGPDSSSMIVLLQENGPCRITNGSLGITLNPFSWNSDSNMLYIDQPVGVGFSHGTMEIGTSLAAAQDVWTFMQIFLRDTRFANLAKSKLAIWTESHGGHYGPAFAAYFLQQNAAIAKGTISGITLNLMALGIGNGSTDPLSQYPGNIYYSLTNSDHPLVSTSVWTTAVDAWAAACTGCRDQSYCNANILAPLAGPYDEYYVLSPSNDPYPPTISAYLATVQTKIGAEVPWSKTNFNVYNNFAATARDLETVINAGVRVTIYARDADYIVNHMGIEMMLNVLRGSWSTDFATRPFSTYFVNGKEAGMYKTAGLLSYLRVYGAGHEVPA
ncbi:serine carboxypeptidase [Mycena latifolia]|nr:serine carboxypeptidase [Mycena latifolia]